MRVFFVDEPERITVVTVHRQVDAIYIDFKDGPVEARTEEIVPGSIFFDYDEADRPAGIEILDASKVLADPATFTAVTLESHGDAR